jgi:hypothetical protein
LYFYLFKNGEIVKAETAREETSRNISKLILIMLCESTKEKRLSSLNEFIQLIESIPSFCGCYTQQIVKKNTKTIQN